VAEKLTAWPYSDGFKLEATAVVVLTWLTV
jgi:hypothetical protein